MKDPRPGPEGSNCSRWVSSRSDGREGGDGGGGGGALSLV